MKKSIKVFASILTMLVINCACNKNNTVTPTNNTQSTTNTNSCEVLGTCMNGVYTFSTSAPGMNTSDTIINNGSFTYKFLGYGINPLYPNSNLGDTCMYQIQQANFNTNCIRNEGVAINYRNLYQAKHPCVIVYTKSFKRICFVK